MVAEKDEQIISLKAEIKQWEDMAITISEKNRQKTKNPTKPNKQKVGFMKKHKKPKSWFSSLDHNLATLLTTKKTVSYCEILYYG